MSAGRLARLSALFVWLALAAPAWASGGDGGPETVWGLPPIFWRVFNFVLFFGGLGYLLSKPLRSFFASRREGIARQLAEATRQRAEAEELRREMEARVAGLQEEIASLRERLRGDGEREREALAQQGEAEAAKLVAQVEQEAGRRIEAARAQLAREASEAAVQLARELLSRELGPADRDRIFRATLERLQQGGPR